LQALVAEASPGDTVGVMCHAERAEVGAWLAAAGATVDTPEAIRRRSSPTTRADHAAALIMQLSHSDAATSG
jgi:hypothetical protein